MAYFLSPEEEPLYDIQEAQEELAAAREEVHVLRGMVNVLADELAKYTGRTMPEEIADARRQCGAGPLTDHELYQEIQESDGC